MPTGRQARSDSDVAISKNWKVQNVNPGKNISFIRGNGYNKITLGDYVVSKKAN